MNRIVQKVSSVWCFLSVFSLFFISVHAEVGPVIPGQSLWCINKSIAGTVDIIESKVCQMDSQLDVIESKIDAIPSDASQLDVIESKIDVIDVTVDIIESKVCEMDSQLDVIESKIDAIPSDASQLDVIESKIDVIDVTVDIIESKVCQIDSQLDVIESKIDAIPSDASQLDVIESKIDVIDVTVDIIESKVCEMDSQLDVIESKIDAIPSDASQLDVIESKIDVIDVTVDFIESKVCEMDSQLDVIESKIDALDGCGPRVLTAADISAGTITLGTPGNYCLSTDLTADIDITANCVTLDLNHRCLTGVISISSDDALIQSGNITPAAPTSTPSPAVSITSTSDRARLYDVLIICADTTADGVLGRAGIQVQGNDTQILQTTIKSGAGESTGI